MTNITLNGKNIATKAQNLIDLIKIYDLNPKKLAIELNLNIIPKNNFVNTKLNSGDKIELVEFVGGG